MIEYRGLHKSFDRPVLTGVDLTVGTGEWVAIVGLSGSGKSVLLKMTIGLVVPDRGDVLVDGNSVFSSPPAVVTAIRRRVGYVFQAAALFDSVSVYENVALGIPEEVAAFLGPSAVRRRVARALEQVGLEPSAVLGKLPADLSGGMRRRVGVARALVGEPKILLYDDPTAGLDPVNAATVIRLLGGIGRRPGVTSVMVTHDIRHALQLAGRVALLHGGRIRFVGTAKEFTASPDPLVRGFLDRQVAATLPTRLLEGA
jgi:phospholipid/cholesterol/gamma-HCH transport system ATP-binding protein